MSLRISKYTLKISELEKQILDKADLELNSGDIGVLIGPNGSGKSSFALSLIGIQGYQKSGSVEVNEEEISGKNIDEIAKAGLFVSFQAPPEIEGLSLFDFINSAYRAIHMEKGLSSFRLRKKIIETATLVGLNESFLSRSTNQGFSGGERRKSEVLQMLILEPKVAILDEVDSGLDIQSNLNIARILKDFAKVQNSTILVISHSPEFIRKLQPKKIIELRDKSFIEVSMDDIEKYSDNINTD